MLYHSCAAVIPPVAIVAVAPEPGAVKLAPAVYNVPITLPITILDPEVYKTIAVVELLVIVSPTTKVPDTALKSRVYAVCVSTVLEVI